MQNWAAAAASGLAEPPNRLNPIFRLSDPPRKALQYTEPKPIAIGDASSGESPKRLVLQNRDSGITGLAQRTYTSWGASCAMGDDFKPAAGELKAVTRNTHCSPVHGRE